MPAAPTGKIKIIFTQNGPWFPCPDPTTCLNFVHADQRAARAMATGRRPRPAGGARPGRMRRRCQRVCRLAQLLLHTDPPSHALNATQVIWQFFAAHRR
jgi:hypothetical protein